MRTRLASRLLIVDDTDRVLLFRYVHRAGPLIGQDFWSTPGGGLEEGETFTQAAIRELTEETGIEIDIADLGPEVGHRVVDLQLPDGEYVTADEHYFLIRTSETSLKQDGWTALERSILSDAMWWSEDDLLTTTATVYPEDLVEMLRSAFAA